MDVSEYIAAEMLKPFEPGVTDCATTADRWFALRRGFSPMFNFGRLVHDDERMALWLSEPGGIVRGMRQVMREAGVARRIECVPGDVGLLAIDRKVCIGIRDLTQWWSRDADGFIVCDDTYRYDSWAVD